MNDLLAQQLEDLVARPTRAPLACEAQLRAAAGTLSRTADEEVSATSVVGVLVDNDREAFEALVQDIADEYELVATVRLRGGSFAVRLTRRAPLAVPPQPRRVGVKALLTGLLSTLRAGG